MRDLIDQGWSLDRDKDGVLLSPPIAVLGAADDPSVAKGGLRASFLFARQAHLAVPSTARFVADMERKGIERLLADGPELAARLETAATGDVPLAATVIPTLQPVDNRSRDATTGLRHMDIWRYMRLHWSIPYQSTPGRNLFYLVRDEAGPDRPVIGIAALGNAVLGLTARDQALGLTADALRERFQASDGRQRRRLLNNLWRVVQVCGQLPAWLPLIRLGRVWGFSDRKETAATAQADRRKTASSSARCAKRAAKAPIGCSSRQAAADSRNTESTKARVRSSCSRKLIHSIVCWIVLHGPRHSVAIPAQFSGRVRLDDRSLANVATALGR